jgi:hypothetical protein
LRIMSTNDGAATATKIEAIAITTIVSTRLKPPLNDLDI